MGYGNKDTPEMMKRLRVIEYPDFKRFRLLDAISGVMIMIKANNDDQVMQVTWLPPNRPENAIDELLPSLLFVNNDTPLDEALDFALEVARTRMCDEMYAPICCDYGYILEKK